MGADCNRKNPLSRSGTNQEARSREALDPSFVRVDERSTADLCLVDGRWKVLRLPE